MEGPTPSVRQLPPPPAAPSRPSLLRYCAAERGGAPFRLCCWGGPDAGYQLTRWGTVLLTGALPADPTCAAVLQPADGGPAGVAVGCGTGLGRVRPPVVVLVGKYGVLHVPMNGCRELLAVSAMPGTAGGCAIIGSGVAGDLQLAHVAHPFALPVLLSHGLGAAVAGTAAVSAAAADGGRVVVAVAAGLQSGVGISTVVCQPARLARPRKDPVGVADTVAMVGGYPRGLLHWHLPQHRGPSFVLHTSHPTEPEGGIVAVADCSFAADGRQAWGSHSTVELKRSPALIGVALVGSKLAIVCADACELWASPTLPLYRASLPVRVRGCPQPFDSSSFAAAAEDGSQCLFGLRADPQCALTAAAVSVICNVVHPPPTSLVSAVLGAGRTGEWPALRSALIASVGGAEATAPPAASTAMERMRLAARWYTEGADAGAPPAAHGALSRSGGVAAFCVLHLFHESARASSTWRPQCRQLSECLHCMSVGLGLGLYAAHYEALNPDLKPVSGGMGEGQPPVAEPELQASLSAVVEHAEWFTDLSAPPDVFGWVTTALKLNLVPVRPFPTVRRGKVDFQLTAAARVLCHIVELKLGNSAGLYERSSVSHTDWDTYGGSRWRVGGTVPIHSDARVVHGTVAAAVQRCPGVVDALRSLGTAPAMLLRQCVTSCRIDPPSAWPPELLRAIGRLDLARLQSDTAGDSATELPDVFLPVNESQEQRLTTATSPLLRSCVSRQSQADVKAEELGISVAGGPLSDSGSSLRWSDDRLEMAKALLCSAVPQKLKCVGDEGADPGEQQAKLAALSKCVLALPVGRGILTHQSLERTPAGPIVVPPLVLCGRRTRDNALTSFDLSGAPPEHTLWPEYLNACSAALRLRAVGADPFPQEWVTSHVLVQSPTATSAGILLGLGLLGYLRGLSKTNIYRVVRERHDPSTVSLLLSLGAHYLGTGDRSITKLMALYLVPLRPMYTDTEIGGSTQAAALISAGLLYQGTCDKLMTEALLGEVSRPPTDEHNANIHAYALAAGFAVGLVGLGQGTAADGEGKLCALLAAMRRTGQAQGEATPGPVVDELDEVPWAGIPSRAAKAVCGQGSVCSRVLPGPWVDTSVVAPAAAVALGLTFLTSDDGVVASRLALPDTAPLLDHISPDAAIARAIAHGLVRWRNVTVSRAWVEELIPPVVLRCTSNLRSRGQDSSDDDAPSMQAGRQQHLVLLRAHTVAGSLFALALRYAGTELLEARDMILENLAGFVAGKCGASDVPLFLGDLPSVSAASADMCICASAVAASVVMAGSGDLTVARHLRKIRRRPDTSYGVHMAVATALGLLFLGAGSRTLSTTPGAVAALLISLYPQYSNTPTDNSHYWQFLRPLYTLAVIPRLLETRDAASGDAVSLAMRISLKEGATVDTMSPCLLPHVGTFNEIVVAASDYHSLRISAARFASRRAVEKGVLWVTRNRQVSESDADDGPANEALVLLKAVARACSSRADPQLMCDLKMVTVAAAGSDTGLDASLVGQAERRLGEWCRVLLQRRDSVALAWHGLPQRIVLRRACAAAGVTRAMPPAAVTPRLLCVLPISSLEGVAAVAKELAAGDVQP
eukprot:TRINITY_DN4117_c0_g6_i1.p1 TRINITY_DN4117_c0_g6~~TRINITY_DN4117_c0_g6_i1.p1  ORF type:complete len:1599 (+),score=409.87 TRINITY_DN4117_c0_g6_i1:42-4799(+)